MFCVLVLILRTGAYRLHEAAISFGGSLCRQAGTENKLPALSLVRQWRVGTRCARAGRSADKRQGNNGMPDSKEQIKDAFSSGASIIS
jgi:hypothetical protein